MDTLRLKLKLRLSLATIRNNFCCVRYRLSVVKIDVNHPKNGAISAWPRYLLYHFGKGICVMNIKQLSKPASGTGT